MFYFFRVRQPIISQDTFFTFAGSIFRRSVFWRSAKNPFLLSNFLVGQSIDSAVVSQKHRNATDKLISNAAAPATAATFFYTALPKTQLDKLFRISSIYLGSSSTQKNDSNWDLFFRLSSDQLNVSLTTEVTTTMIFCSFVFLSVLRHSTSSEVSSNRVES